MESHLLSVGRDVLAGMLCAAAVMIPFTVLMLVGQHYGIAFPRGLPTTTT